MQKRARVGIVAATVVLLMGVSLLVFGNRRNNSRFAVAPVDRGDISDVVGATGILQAVTTVQVGSQVSGTIQTLHADFNSTVKKGEVVARLDPSLFEARVAQAQANLASSRANVDKSQATVDDTRQKYERAKELAAQNLLPRSDLDSAQAAYDAALAANRADRSAVAQSGAALNQAKVDLEHTVIQAPIDGVVLARNVDVGQTVAASLQAPTLFVIANDLTRMEVNASIDEADIGRVDAFPDATFAGSLKQVRLQPVTTNNVVTYNTIVSVENPGQKLMPGMTATVSVIVDSRKDVLRLPAAALRFRPEGFEERARGSGRGGEGRQWAGREGRAQGGRDTRDPSEAPRGRPGLVFVLDEDAKPRPMRVRLGLADGQHAEILEGLSDGAQVVVGLEGQPGTRTAARPGSSPAPNNPFAPQRPQPRTR
jgi:HlyD family secretion protein